MIQRFTNPLDAIGKRVVDVRVLGPHLCFLFTDDTALVLTASFRGTGEELTPLQGLALGLISPEERAMIQDISKPEPKQSPAKSLMEELNRLVKGEQ